MLKPQIEGAAVKPRGFRLGEFFKRRIDARLHGPLAEEVGAEGVDRADARFLEPRQRVLHARQLVAKQKAKLRVDAAREGMTIELSGNRIGLPAIKSCARPAFVNRLAPTIAS